MDDLDKLVDSLRFNGRYAVETQDMAATRRVQEREAAATALLQLRSERDELRMEICGGDEHIDPPTPLGALKFRMEQGNLTPADLGRLLGSRARASEILSGKRGMSKEQIALLVDNWGIPARSLLGPDRTHWKERALSAERQLAEAREALRPFAKLARMFRAKPLRGMGDTLYAIHVGTEWEAEITWSDMDRAALAIEDTALAASWGMSDPERIVAAAHLYNVSRAYDLRAVPTIVSAPPPARHHNLFALTGGLSPDESGFLTSEGRFVDRREALRIALASGQPMIDHPSRNDTYLFSEDLW